MGTTFRPYQPDQMLLLPQDLREWVLEGHLAHHVSDLVDALDLSPFYAPYEGDGRRNSPYDRGQAELVGSVEPGLRIFERINVRIALIVQPSSIVCITGLFTCI